MTMTQSAQTLWTRLIDHLRAPLFRNAYALIVNEGASAVLGLVYWVIVVRLYPAEIVGLNATAISTMALSIGFSALSLGGPFIRYLPTLGKYASAFILRAYGVSVTLALFLGLLLILTRHIWFSAGVSVLGESSAFHIVYVLGSAVLCIFMLQDTALTGLRHATIVPVENFVYNIAKIVLVVVLANVFPHHGIWLSWALPGVLSVIPVNYIIFRRLLPKHAASTPEPAQRIPFRQLAVFTLSNHAGEVLAMASVSLLPVLVINRLGPVSTAHFNQAWLLSVSLYNMAWNMCSSFTVEASRDMRALRDTFVRSARQMLRLIGPASVIVAIAAPLLLTVFGEGYAREGKTLLSLLALGAIPNMVNTLTLSLARVRHNIKVMLAMRLLLYLGSLVLGYVLLIATNTIAGIGIAILAVQCAVAVMMIPYLIHIRAKWREEPVDGPSTASR